MAMSRRFGAKLTEFLSRKTRALNKNIATGTRDREKRKPRTLVTLVLYLRWTIAVVVSFVGIGNILVEQVVLGGNSISEPTVVRGLLIVGSAGPVLVWITLTWAAR